MPFILIVISLMLVPPILLLGCDIIRDIIKYYRYNSKEVEESTNDIIHARTDWYHIAFGKVRSFDYNMSTTMFKIHHLICASKTENYDRFYTVYCKEICNAYDSANEMATPKSKSEALHKISETYNVIFDTMLVNITKYVDGKSDISAEVDGVKNFAELNGDYNPNKEQESKKKSIDYRALLLDKLDNYVKRTGYILTYCGDDLRDLVKVASVVDKDVYDKFCVIATRVAFGNWVDYGLEYNKESEEFIDSILNHKELGITQNTYAHSDGSSDTVLVNNDGTLFRNKVVKHKSGVKRTSTVMYNHYDVVEHYVSSCKEIEKSYAKTLMGNPLTKEIDL